MRMFQHLEERFFFVGETEDERLDSKDSAEDIGVRRTAIFISCKGKSVPLQARGVQRVPGS